MSGAHPNISPLRKRVQAKGGASAASSAGGMCTLGVPTHAQEQTSVVSSSEPVQSSCGEHGVLPWGLPPTIRSLLSLPATLTRQATASSCPGGDTGSTVTSQLYIPSHHRHQQGSQQERAVQSDRKQCANEPGNFTNSTELKKTRIIHIHHQN